MSEISKEMVEAAWDKFWAAQTKLSLAVAYYATAEEIQSLKTEADNLHTEWLDLDMEFLQAADGGTPGARP